VPRVAAAPGAVICAPRDRLPTLPHIRCNRVLFRFRAWI
jgi:hypothetical protein